MEIARMVLIGLLSLGLLVVVHEFGHFWMARRFGVAVLRFSIGFGRPFYTWVDRHGTQFALAPIPLGGYVHMHGENPDADEQESSADPGLRSEARSFANKALWQRALIVVAGPAINLLLAVALFWGLFVVGENGARAIVGHVAAGSVAERAGLAAGMEILALDGEAIEFDQDLYMQLLERVDAGDASLQLLVRDGARQRQLSLSPPAADWLSARARQNDFLALALRDALGFGLRPLYPARLERVSAAGAGAAAGLRAGDVVVAVDGRAILGWGDFVEQVRARAERDTRILIERQGQRMNIVVRPEAVLEQGRRIGRLGISVAGAEPDAEVRRQRRHAPTAALGRAVERSWELSALTFNALGQMITGALSPKQLSGPITIVRLAGKAAEVDWRVWISLLALISLNLGILNLLPIPLLDGGHLLYLGAEAIRGRPLSERVRMVGQFIGIAIVVGVMLMATYNDIALLLQR